MRMQTFETYDEANENRKEGEISVQDMRDGSFYNIPNPDVEEEE